MNILQFEAFRLELAAQRLWQGEDEVQLTAKAFAVLRYLVEHRQRLVSRDGLFEAVWGTPYVSEAALAACIRELRRALGDSAQQPTFIQTVRGRGYRFVAAVTPLEAPAPLTPATASDVPPMAASGVPQTLAAERRQLTVLFCDLVDSTRLAQQLDPEDLREVLQAYHQSCAEVVEHFGGYVAQYLGDGVLVYFGYPVAHEDDARRAIHVGLRLIDAVADCNARLESDHGIQLSVRIGIHTGLVVVGHEGEGAERLAVGATPNLAAHLQEFAAPNTVVISAQTHELTQGFFDVEALGAHALKGASQPTALYRVLGDSGLHSRFDVAFARGLTPLVGREQEVGLILERWERAQGGQGQVILLSGEAGIGKSRLVQVLKERASDQTHTCLECRSLPYLTNSALSPVIDLLQRLWQFEADDTPITKLAKLEHHLESYRLALDECVPLFGALLSFPVPQSRYAPLVVTPQRQRQKTLEATVTLLLAMAERQPLLVVLEDLHWTDPTTLALLELLIDQTPTAALGVVLTCRPDFEPTWRHRSYLSELRINRLTPPQIEHMVTHVAGGKQLPEAITTSLEDKSDGVPLYIEEMTKSLLESGYLKAMDGHYELTEALSSLAIPATLQDSLMARLDRLGTAKVVAQYGSVIGRQFSYALLQVVSQLDTTMLQRELGRLVEAELLYQKGLPPHATYIFKHALVRDSAYESLLKSFRQQYHQRIAYTLEKQFTDTAENQPELLAYHFMQGNVWEKALAYFSQAAKKATQALATHEALSLYEQALDAAHRVDPPVAPQVLLSIHQAKVDLYVITSDYECAWAEGERYLALAQEAGDQMHEGVALVSMGMASILDHHIDRGLTYAQRAIAVTQAANAKGIQAGSHSTAGLALGVLGRLDLAWSEINQAIIVGRDAGAVAHESFALGFAGLMKNWAGEYTEASQLCTQALDIARAHSLLMPHSHTLLFHAFTLIGTGAYDAALGSLEEEFSLAEKVGDEAMHLRALNTLGWLYTELGDLDRAIAPNQQSAEGGRQRNDVETVANAELNLGDLFLAKGDLALAREFFDGVYRLAKDPTTTEWLKWRYSMHLFASFGEWWLAYGDPATAQEFMEQGLEIAIRTNSRKYLVQCRRLQGNIALARGLHQEAEYQFQQALTLAQTLANPTQLWKTHLSWGQLHDAAHRREMAQQSYQAARAVIDQIKANIQTLDLRANMGHSPMMQHVYDLAVS